jgi:hypothetical protein
VSVWHIALLDTHNAVEISDAVEKYVLDCIIAKKIFEKGLNPSLYIH